MSILGFGHWIFRNQARTCSKWRCWWLGMAVGLVGNFCMHFMFLHPRIVFLIVRFVQVASGVCKFRPPGGQPKHRCDTDLMLRRTSVAISKPDFRRASVFGFIDFPSW